MNSNSRMNSGHISANEPSTFGFDGGWAIFTSPRRVPVTYGAYKRSSC